MADVPGLEELGYSPRWQALFAPHADAGLRPARVVRSDRGSWLVAGAAGVERAARGCRFRDCMHEDEPDCAVRAAVETGALPAERLASWHKLVHESRGAARRSDVRLRAEEQRRWKIIRKSAREFYKRTGRGR